VSTVAAPSAVAALTFDADGDITFAPGPSATTVPNPFSLPDAAGVGVPTPSVINALLTSPDGTLYGSNALAGQGVERSLNPTASITAPAEAAVAPVFERMIKQIPATATLAGLWLVVDPAIDVTGSKNVLFSIDTTGVAGVDRILTFTDTLATEVVLTAPETGTIFPQVEDVPLEWETLTGALSYHWQIARDAFFVLVQDEGFSIYPTVTSDQLRAGQTYYWRVRVDSPPVGAPGAPLLSRWSETRTFTTSAIVEISVVLQGSSRPDEGWEIPVNVKFFTPGADVLNDSPLYEFNFTTAKSDGTATCQCFGVLPDTYDITVVSEHTLLNVRGGVIIPEIDTLVDMCTLLEGNANDDIIVDISDFGILALSFMELEGNPGYDARADFERNGIIDIHDFGLLAINFMKYSPVDCTD